MLPLPLWEHVTESVGVALGEADREVVAVAELMNEEQVLLMLQSALLLA